MAKRFQPSRNRFSGLWLHDASKPDPDRKSALLFVVAPEANYGVRLNFPILNEKDRQGLTEEEVREEEYSSSDAWVWDYVVMSNSIVKHPRGMPDDVQIEIPWRGLDGTLALKTGEGDEWEYFRPAVFEDLYAAGFSQRFVREVLGEINEKGWAYDLKCAVPVSAPSSQK
jgi:hypothetical protein